IAEGGRPRVVLSAHLDTVFPFKAISVTRENTILRAPGIADDSAGLSALLLLGRAFLRFPRTKGSLILLATVGEEGLGNLRGARHFFSHHDEIDYFISLDGSDAQRIVTQGLASKRLRIFFRGPGGHSWADSGTSNPVYTAAEFLLQIKRLDLPLKPKTTINAGVLRGGTSVNAIPAEVSLDMDLRSESADQLIRLLDGIERNLDFIKSQDKEIQYEIVPLGDRPAGAIRNDHPMALLAAAASEYFAMSVQFVSGSTDCNIPLSIGIPALSFGVGGRCGKIHTPHEWYDYHGGETGLKRTALLVSELLEAK
ncbi:MAG TPA: M20/M25/M40 family metallo-hydrolase, partial [Acidobacteriota bacterium]